MADFGKQFYLTESDRDAVASLIREVKLRDQNTVNRIGDRLADEQEILPPEVYVALSPTDHAIPPIADEPGTGTRVDPTTGVPIFSGLCHVYRVLFQGSQFLLLPVPDLYPVEVFNFSDQAIPAGHWVLVQRDKFGTWFTGQGTAGGGGGGIQCITAYANYPCPNTVQTAVGPHCLVHFLCSCYVGFLIGEDPARTEIRVLSYWSGININYGATFSTVDNLVFNPSHFSLGPASPVCLVDPVPHQGVFIAWRGLTVRYDYPCPGPLGQPAVGPETQLHFVCSCYVGFIAADVGGEIQIEGYWFGLVINRGEFVNVDHVFFDPRFFLLSPISPACSTDPVMHEGVLVSLMPRGASQLIWGGTGGVGCCADVTCPSIPDPLPLGPAAFLEFEGSCHTIFTVDFLPGDNTSPNPLDWSRLLITNYWCGFIVIDGSGNEIDEVDTLQFSTDFKVQSDDSTKCLLDLNAGILHQIAKVALDDCGTGKRGADATISLLCQVSFDQNTCLLSGMQLDLHICNGRIMEIDGPFELGPATTIGSCDITPGP